MFWRLRHRLRRARLFAARLAAKSPVGMVLRGLLPMYLVIGVAVAGFWWARATPIPFAGVMDKAAAVAGEWARAGKTFAFGQLSTNLDAEAAKTLMKSVLPVFSQGNIGPEPLGSWRAPMRAWVYAATGYDFTSPRTFFEVELSGFRSALQREMDVVRVPADNAKVSPGAELPPPGKSVEKAPERSPADMVPPPQKTKESKGRSAKNGVTNEETPPHGKEEVPPVPQVSPPRREREAQPSAADVPAALASLTETRWGNQPLVLIVHSHTSESYRTEPPDPRLSDDNHIFNSADTGITRVGKALAEKLQEKYHIGTVHSTRIHDWPHFWDAYTNSRKTVKELLEKYPSIQVVLDIHRQGVKGYTFATDVQGIDAVGVDIIYTTAQNVKYAAHPTWRKNAAFAEQFAAAMDELHPGLLRRVMRVDNSLYNQDLFPRMLLLEVGNHLDLQQEAVAAAQLLADPIAAVLSELRADRADRSQGTDSSRQAAAVAPPMPPRPTPQGRAPSV